MDGIVRRLIPGLMMLFCLPAWALDCSSPTLKGASGVIGTEHVYKISGQCSQHWHKTYTQAGSSTTVNEGVKFDYAGSASWERSSGIAKEVLKYTGDYYTQDPKLSGERYAEAHCTQDPFLKNPPGGDAKCGPVKVSVNMKSGTDYDFQFLTPKTFWSGKKISLAEAQALSAQLAASKSTPKPPAAQQPPVLSTAGVLKPTTPTLPAKPVAPAPSASSTPVAANTRRVVGTAPASTPPPQDPAVRAEMIKRAVSIRVAEPAPAATGRPVLMEIEGESLVRSGAIQVAGGNVQVQPMTGFGGGWSGGEQLFWSGGSTGAVLDLFFEVSAASRYAIEIYLTRAPDYGKLQFEVDGRQSDMTFDGMAPEVMTSGPIQLGTFTLHPGKRAISLMITGKYSQSTGYLVGIDKLRLYPAGPIN